MDDVKRLIAREMPKLRSYARKLENNPDAAEDLLQDSLERAIRKCHLWEGRGSIRSWLYRLLFNVFANSTPRRIRERGEIPLDEGPPVVEAPRQEHGLMCRDIALAVGSLPDKQREAVRLFAANELSYDEAARVTGVPVGTFRSRLSRARDRLRVVHAGKV